MKGGGERGEKKREREIHWTNSRALCEDNLKKKRGGEDKKEREMAVFIASGTKW